MNSSRNHILELFKLLASYMVVFIHIPFYGTTGTIMDALARFAVPLFFVISGFYSRGISPKHIKKRIGSLLRLLVFAAIVYNLYQTLPFLVAGYTDVVIQFLRGYLDITALIKLFLLNQPVYFVHFWYLYASICVYLVFCFVSRRNINQRILFWVCIGLLAVNILLGEVLSAFGVIVPIYYSRNFLFMGLPFFGLGLIASAYQEKLRTLPGYVIALCFVLGTLLTLLSRFLFGKNELYIGSLLLLFAVMVICLKYSHVKLPIFLTALEGCSTYIFLLHIVISLSIMNLYVRFGVDYQSVGMQMLHPLIVCVASTILAFGIKSLINAWKLLQNKIRNR